MSKNDANVSWNALMIHVDSASFMPSATTSEGMAEYSDELLTVSRNCARQKMTSSTYLRAAEYVAGAGGPSVPFSLFFSSTSVGTGEEAEALAAAAGSGASDMAGVTKTGEAGSVGGSADEAAQMRTEGRRGTQIFVYICPSDEF